MNNKLVYRIVLFLILLQFGCKTDTVNTTDIRIAKKSTKENIRTGPDSLTKVMIDRVAQSVQKIEPTKVPYIFSSKKASMIKSQINAAVGFDKISLQLAYGIELMRSGLTEESIQILTTVLGSLEGQNFAGNNNNIFLIKKQLAIANMRKAEQDNCIANHNDESCIIPFSKKAQHQIKKGAEEAIKLLNQLLRIQPNDLECQYLLNIAHMVLGQYPDQVPQQFRLPEENFTNKTIFPRFKDIGTSLGVAVNQRAGGTCVDDFNNDGYLDIIASSWGFQDQIRYFENNTNGGFTDKTLSSGLEEVYGGLNIKHADFNNDGHLDFIILRGAWLGDYGKIPNSLMRNNGDGTFTDVTISSGLYSLYPTQTAVWGDFDLNGWIDLFIANETSESNQNFCELFLNTNGKFKEVSTESGLDKTGFFKGVACGDIDNDGYLDLYLSSYSSENVLYKNSYKDGKLTFTDVTQSAGVKEPIRSFSTWIFDYDNDGHDDIFVSGYSELNKTPAMLMVENIKNKYTGNRPLLYHNNGDGTFTDRSLEYGLIESATTMGCNFGDLNNDGFLDFYLATGDPSFFSIVPNKVYLNKDGKSFQDITYTSGFGHIQKGHAVGFGDIDMDGDQDIYVVMGGSFEGDVFGNLLYENPVGNKNNWIHIMLEGEQSNRSAIGAKIAIQISENNSVRNIFHTVGIDGSFGGNSLMAEIGLGNAVIIKSIEIKWPNQQKSITVLHDIGVNQIIKVSESNNKVEKMNFIHTPFEQSKKEHQHHH